MLKVNLHATGSAEFDVQRTGDEIQDSPIVPGGTITVEGVIYTIISVGMTGGTQDGDDWIAEVSIEVELA